MNPAIKIIIGLILIIAGLTLFIDEITPVISQFKGIPARPWLSSFITVLQGIIPAFLIIVGLFVVWLESDELKSEKEIKEVKKEEPKKEEQVAPKPIEKTEKPEKKAK